jgi:hypothetical protein
VWNFSNSRLFADACHAIQSYVDSSNVLIGRCRLAAKVLADSVPKERRCDNTSLGGSMKKLVSLTAITIAAMLIALPLAHGQGQARPQADKTFEGQLTKVDASTKTISAKGKTEEMAFKYTDQTQIVGGEKDVQGLATKTGASLKITYQDAGNNNHVATKIEVIPQK